jgi:trehalose 6-phosphate synthase/phosphatase
MKSTVNDNKLSELVEKIKDARQRLILLDFDGTLVDFKPDISAAVPSRNLLNLLKKLAAASDTQLIIITGRRQDNIDRLVGHLPIDIIAEHGSMIRENRIWRTLLDGASGWKKEVFPVMNEYCSMTPNSFIEEKHFSLAWHFRNADQQTGKNNARALTSALKKVTLQNDLKILDGVSR